MSGFEFRVFISHHYIQLFNLPGNLENQSNVDGGQVLRKTYLPEWFVRRFAKNVFNFFIHPFPIRAAAAGHHLGSSLFGSCNVARILTDRIVDRRDPEYGIILRIVSGSHSDFKFARNDRNGDPWEGRRSDPFTSSQSYALDCVI